MAAPCCTSRVMFRRVQGRGSIIAIGGGKLVRFTRCQLMPVPPDKATDRASTDRGRAIQTLRFKVCAAQRKSTCKSDSEGSRTAQSRRCGSSAAGICWHI